MVLVNKNFKTLVMYFRYFVISSPWKRPWPFILTYLNPLPSRMLWATFCWNLPGGFWEEDNVLSLFHNYFPLEKDVALYLTNLNTLYPRMLCIKFGWNWPSGSRVEDEMWKVYRRTDGRRMAGDQKSSFELLADMS